MPMQVLSIEKTCRATRKTTEVNYDRLDTFSIMKAPLSLALFYPIPNPQADLSPGGLRQLCAHVQSCR